MSKKQVYEALIDSFIYTEYPTETPAYQAIMRERVLDLCSRGVKLTDAQAYLKSGGWSAEFSEIYEKFLKFCATKQSKSAEPRQQSKDTSDPTIKLSQAQELLKALVVELAESAGFRELQQGEDIRDYRKEFQQFLNQRVSDVAEDQLRDICTQPSVSIKHE